MPKMAPVKFYKYQGTGNDFILIDNRKAIFPEGSEVIKKICDRRFGIGSDGLILIQNHAKADFEMVFFNPDGSLSLCGNGSRCAVKFVLDQKMISTKNPVFHAYDGLHQATLLGDDVRISLHDVHELMPHPEGLWLNTGSPHLVVFENLDDASDITEKGRKLRSDSRFQPGGTNVNFVKMEQGNEITVRTYERGVEAETLSCGTGVTAAALSAGARGKQSPILVNTLGGQLVVGFSPEGDSFKDIYLQGPAHLVFEGTITI